MEPPQDEDSSTTTAAEGTPRKPSQRRVYRECIPPPPASWPTANSTPCGGSSGFAGAPTLPTQQGFGEQMEVFVSGRKAKFLVRVAGRELAAANGVVVVLHGVRMFQQKLS